MKASRRIRLRREGWYYLGVLAFIIGGAALRQVNLLIVLAGLMVGPLVFNWRLVAATIRRLRVHRRLPRRIAAGDLLLVDLAVTNLRPRLDSWVVAVEDSIALEGPAAGRENRTKVEVVFPHVPVGQTSKQSYRCHLSRRGRYRFGPLRISSRFPLGLVQGDTTVAQYETLVVCPRMGTLSRAWGNLVESQRAGSQRSQRQRGLVEGDFYGLRDFRPGDTRRWIHWRTSARRGEITVRQFERQGNRDVALIVDLWLPPEPTTQQLEHVELAVSFAATAVADLCKRGGSRLLVSITGETHSQHAATASQVFMHDVLEQLAVVEGGESAGLAEGLRHALSASATAARTIVLSTRPREACELAGTGPFRADRRLAAALAQTPWIDVSSGAAGEYFHWRSPS